jgi:hypothetical protein
VSRSGVPRAFLLLFGVLLLATGLALAASTDGDDRTVWLLCVAPLGVAALAAAAHRPPSRQDLSGVVAGSVVARGQALQGTLVTASRRGGVAGLVGCAAFAVAGVGFVTVPEELGPDVGAIRVLGVVCVVLFGGVGLVGVASLARGSGGVFLAPEGIANGSGGTFVPWSGIVDVVVLSVRGTEMLGLRVASSSVVRTSPWARWLLPLNRRAGADVAFPFSLASADGDLLAAVVRRLLDHPEDRAWLASPGGAEALRRLAPP